MKTLGLPLLGLVCSSALASAVPTSDYQKDVKPIFRVRCVACHGAVHQKANLRLDASPLIRTGSKNGPVVVASKSGESLLIDAVLGQDRSRMPPEKEGKALSRQQIDVLRAWIGQGRQKGSGTDITLVKRLVECGRRSGSVDRSGARSRRAGRPQASGAHCSRGAARTRCVPVP